MKKIFALVLTICLMATAFCVTAFATEAPEASTVASSGAYDTVENSERSNATGSIIIDGLPNGPRPSKLGTMLGEGTLSMVVSMTALVVSVASLCVAIAANKKKDSANGKSNKNSLN